MTKWISNNREVLLTIPEEQRSKILHELDLDRDQLLAERVLGLHWCIETDTFKFKMVLKEQPPNRWGILFIWLFLHRSHFQQSSDYRTCAEGATDGMIRFQQQWIKWLRDLENATAFNVNRCLKPLDFGQPAHSVTSHLRCQ